MIKLLAKTIGPISLIFSHHPTLFLVLGFFLIDFRFLVFLFVSCIFLGKVAQEADMLCRSRFQARLDVDAITAECIAHGSCANIH